MIILYRIIVKHMYCICLRLPNNGFVLSHISQGLLSDGSMIAVKRLSSKAEKNSVEFLNEVATISAVQHRNLVKLIGCCVQGNHKILVFEFLQNNSLQQYLQGRLWHHTALVCTYSISLWHFASFQQTNHPLLGLRDSIYVLELHEDLHIYMKRQGHESCIEI